MKITCKKSKGFEHKNNSLCVQGFYLKFARLNFQNYYLEEENLKEFITNFPIMNIIAAKKTEKNDYGVKKYKNY